MRKRPTTRTVSVLVALGCLGLAHRAQAAPTADLTGSSAAQGCLDIDALKGAVESRLDRKVFVDRAQADLWLTARMAPAPPPGTGWDAVIEVATRQGIPAGVRRLHTDTADCHELDSQLGLVVALLVDADPTSPAAPTSAKEKSRPESADESSGMHGVRTERVAERERPRVENAAASASELSLGLSGQVAFGLLPRPAEGLAAHVLWRPAGTWGLRAGAEGWWPQSSDVAATATARFVSAAATLAGCTAAVSFVFTRTEFCAGIDAGGYHAEGSGLIPAKSSWTPLLSPVASVSVSVGISGPLFLNFTGSLSAPLIRDRFAYQDSGATYETIFRVAPFVAAAGAGLMFVFPTQK